jgi:hypothetical protein
MENIFEDDENVQVNILIYLPHFSLQQSERVETSYQNQGRMFIPLPVGPIPGVSRPAIQVKELCVNKHTTTSQENINSDSL